MKDAIRISIPTPCQEKWETFSSASHGKFCSSCSKTIIDFTKLGDDEIVAYLGKHSGVVCGRFRQDQLKTYREVPAPRIYPGFVLLRAGIIWLLLALISRVSFAANMATPVKTEIGIDNTNRSTFNVANMNQTVRGIVTSLEDGMPLPGVNVTIQGANMGTVTDAEGRFELSDLKPGDVLVFAFIGLETMEYVVKANEYVLDIKLAFNLMTLGEVLIEPAAPATNTGGFWSRLFRWN